MSRIETPDDQTLVIHWKETYRRANAVYRNRLSPVPRHLLEADYQAGGGEVIPNHSYWTSAFVGSGPFKIVSWDQGREIELEAFDQYLLGRPKIDRIDWRFIFDVNAVLANVLSNNVDVVLREAVQLRHRARRETPVGGARAKGGALHAGHDPVGESVAAEPLAVDPKRTPRAAPRHRPTGDRRDAVTRAGACSRIFRCRQSGRNTSAPSLRAPCTTTARNGRASCLPKRAGPGSDGVMVNARGERFSMDGRNIRNDTQQLQAATVDYWKRLGVDVQINNLSARQEQGEEFRGRWSGARWTAASVSVESWVNRFGSTNIPTAENRWNGGNESRWDDPMKETVLQELEQTLDPRRADQLIVEF